MSSILTRKTTPMHIFRFTGEIQPEDCMSISIIYAQNGQVILEKSKDELTIEADKVHYMLTQQETAKFNPTGSIRIEVWVKLHTGFVPRPMKYVMSVENVIGGDFK